MPQICLQGELQTEFTCTILMGTPNPAPSPTPHSDVTNPIECRALPHVNFKYKLKLTYIFPQSTVCLFLKSIHILFCQKMAINKIIK